MTTQDKPQAELLPCPFCGGTETHITPQGRTWKGMEWGEASHWLVRHHCISVVGQPSRGIERVGRDEESAIVAWNRRATRPVNAQLLEAPLIDSIFEVFQGWMSATYGWQDHDDPEVALQNYEDARQAHNDECKRRIRAAIAAHHGSEG